MDQLQSATPIKNEEKKCDGLGIRSPVVYKTPVKQYKSISKNATYQNNISCFSVLPSHITPPSGLTKFIARNPFETDLTSRLHLSVISPTVFTKVSSPSQQSPDFAWSVDELATMKPAWIEEFPEQQIHCVDPDTEVKAQAAIDRFFKENQIIPSPWDLKRKDGRVKIKTDTPTRVCSDANAASSKSKRDGWSQTVLSLPPQLPSHVADALKPYFTFTQEQNAESDDANSSNNSLRRKLFFNHDECMENAEESSASLSSVNLNGSPILSSGHTQSGILLNGVPFKASRDSDDRHNASQIVPGHLSSPDISPIHRGENLSCDSLKSRSRSVVRLDFSTEMILDQFSMQNKECSNDNSLDISLDNVKAPTAKYEMHRFSNFDSKCEYAEISDSPKTKIVVKSSTYIERNFETEDTEFSSKDQNDINTFTKLGMSDQQSVSNSVQDTGYQTYSMSSTVNMTNSCNGTPVKQNIYCGERILLNDDEFHMSDWKENMRNMFCSTPSRTHRENHIF